MPRRNQWRKSDCKWRERPRTDESEAAVRSVGSPSNGVAGLHADATTLDRLPAVGSPSIMVVGSPSNLMTTGSPPHVVAAGSPPHVVAESPPHVVAEIPPHVVAESPPHVIELSPSRVGANHSISQETQRNYQANHSISQETQRNYQTNISISQETQTNISQFK